MNQTEKKIKKTFVGKVIKITNGNTIKIVVERKYSHKKYGKIIKDHKKYMAHNDGSLGEIALNDMVLIEEMKPVSKKKTWLLKEKYS